MNGSRDSYVNRYAVERDGTLRDGRLFTDMKGTEPGITDGLLVDTRGNPYETGPGECGSFHRNAGISAPSGPPRYPPTSVSAMPTAGRSTSRRAPASTGSA